MSKPYDEENSTDSIILLGAIWLDNGQLIVDANSHERAERAEALLREHLGTSIGKVIKVHHSVEKLLQDGPTENPDPTDLNDDPEMRALLENTLKTHYQNTLDEKIPMLNNLTPRECAADPETQQLAIDWLKYLENSDQGREQPTMGFGWMWEELGLSRDEA